MQYTEEEIIAELKKSYGENAMFHPGQLEAIEAVLDEKRTLVVQKTGWGKSLVYFMATKMMRKHQKDKFTIIISPLLVLMDNQIDSASKLGLTVRTINSENKEQWNSVLEEAGTGQIDALIISPERLGNSAFREKLSHGLTRRIGMFVVDEAHCISDWGHDFRPDYRRIIELIQLLPKNVPVLATTATANDRVVNDIQAQLGQDIQISRGALLRETIAIQTIRLDTREERLVWILNHIDEMPGSGIVYCLTVNDCKLVNKWLQENGVKSEAYYANVEAEKKSAIVDKFMRNEIKVLSATVAFGMGFDKPDIGFVIHFQKPGNLVAYYQQIGRAGRKPNSSAYAVLLYGAIDDKINSFFIDSAFPTEKDMDELVRVIMENPGSNRRQITAATNMKSGRVEKSLKYLEVNNDIYVEGSKYYKTMRVWKPDMERSQTITRKRYQELADMNNYAITTQCYMEYIARELDDKTAAACGKCSNCLGRKIFATDISQEDLDRAGKFLKEDYNVIPARKQWPEKGCYGKLSIEEKFRMQEGRVLSNYGDAGWGSLVSEDKYLHGYFRDQLVDASVELLKDFVKEHGILNVTYIPSLRRPELVKNFAERLAGRLGLGFFTGLEKKENAVCQKELNNSYRQWENVEASFEAIQFCSGNTLLVDDMVDSRWTLTVCGYKLLKMGNGSVYPFALANSVGKGK